MIGDATIIGKPSLDRLARVSRSTVAAPAIIGAQCTLIDSVVMGAVEIRYVTLIGVRISGYGRVNGHTREYEDTALIIRADAEVWQSDNVRIGPNVDWQGVAILGDGRISGHVTIEPAVRESELDGLPALWRSEHRSGPQCADDLAFILAGRVRNDSFMGELQNVRVAKPRQVASRRFDP